ncbi:MAG: biotin--[acetyl-CoA-carboxylase] ligase [Prevotellaceae bacterium]|jgi:BirA family biotin operon repressor/biotin-[acetyl-CoA-carboxylase] ligase|nr:biotin--[acetyl-CoA-carboxylase] ligase [Prevotellaceae bacterium]
MIYYNRLPSSNTEAARLAVDGVEEGITVVCREQTAGRGQRENKWLTNPFENLTMSLVLRPSLAARELFLLSKAFSIAVIDSLSGFGVEARIKWPNDIYVENRKIAGILIEHSFKGNSLEYTVIGLGLNVRQTVFPPFDIVPTSIALETGIMHRPDDVLKTVLDCFLPLYTMCNSPIDEHKTLTAQRYMEKLYRNKGFFPYQRPKGEMFEAEVVAVANSGELILKAKSGETESFMFKEIAYAKL